MAAAGRPAAAPWTLRISSLVVHSAAPILICEREAIAAATVGLRAAGIKFVAPRRLRCFREDVDGTHRARLYRDLLLPTRTVAPDGDRAARHAAGGPRRQHARLPHGRSQAAANRRWRQRCRPCCDGLGGR